MSSIILSQLTNLSSKFNTIAEKLHSEYNTKDILIPIAKMIANDQFFYIQLHYKKSTQYNPLKEDVLFSITIPQSYPLEEPYVRSISNFSFPTLFDNRNLLLSIIQHAWKSSDLENDLYSPIDEIIKGIPLLIKRVNEDSNNQVMVYYGDYRIDNIYEINDFLSNDQLNLFRVVLYQKEKKERYIVLTEVYFLLFDPAPDAKNLGKLVFWGDIRQLSNRKKGKIKDAETVILCWKGGPKDIMFEFEVVKEKLDLFYSEVDKKIKKLVDKYTVFQEDEKKPIESNEYQNEILVTKENIGNVKAMVLYKEKLYEKEKSLYIIKELTSLYEKIIEVLSAENDAGFEVYLEKMKKLLVEKEKMEHTNEESSQKKFMMSKSYTEES